jgi:diguanylate cyclase (GGDEF)-like protein
MKAEPQTLARLWSIGAQGHPPHRARQIVLVNQIALFPAGVTALYQLLYLALDAVYFLPLVLLNLFFIACYLVTLPLNHAGRHLLARNLVLGTIYVHLFVATALLGTGSGVHLFYFALGSSLGLLYANRREPWTLLLMALAAGLFLYCHFTFVPGGTPLELPDHVLNAVFAGSAVGAVFLAGSFTILFRQDIDRSEQLLTRSNEELERLTGLDPLTGLANRRMLAEHLDREWRRLKRHGQPLSALMCDVDCFKTFNDHYGHLAGDQCLRQVAGALASTAGRASDLVARYGGEEFVVVLPATDLAGAMVVAEQIRRRVMEMRLPHAQSHVADVVTVSIGVVCADPAELDEPQELLRRADAALYTAKLGGRNRAEEWSEGDRRPGSPA